MAWWGNTVGLLPSAAPPHIDPPSRMLYIPLTLPQQVLGLLPLVTTMLGALIPEVGGLHAVATDGASQFGAFCVLLAKVV